MKRPIAVVGAPSSIGAAPYTDGEPQNLDRAPGVLRERGLVQRLGALDMGTVEPPPYRDYVACPGGLRNERDVAAYSAAVGARVAAALRAGRFTLVLGGDSSIVLGCLLGARIAVGGPLGLAHLDAHADAGRMEESQTGAVAGLAMALALGNGNSPLAWLAGSVPLVEAERLAVVGSRDLRNAHHASAGPGVLAVGDVQIALEGPDAVAAAVIDRVTSSDAGGFWIHLDADALNPAVMPAVRSPIAGGPALNETVALLRPLVQHPKALGLALTNYDPAFDPDRACARLLVALLERLFVCHSVEVAPADGAAVALSGPRP
jgi:arginase